jgi:hypothetical protein
MTKPSGYSGTPLARKLGIKPGFKLVFHNVPDHYFELFEDFPEGTEIVENPKSNDSDFIHVFYTNFEDLKRNIPAFIKALKKTGSLWISWPKGSSDLSCDFNRDDVRTHLLNLGLVDTKVAAIDEDWSGLKFMYRIKDR